VPEANGAAGVPKVSFAVSIDLNYYCSDSAITIALQPILLLMD
jgi:hypothetical protein